MIERVEQRRSALLHVVSEWRFDIDFVAKRNCVDAVTDQFWLIQCGLAGCWNSDAEIVVAADSGYVCIERSQHDVEQ